MATEWFIYREDGRHGPYSSAEIRSLARSGGLQPSDRLWKQGMRKTRRAGRSAKLFPPAAPAAKPAAAPEFWFDDPRLMRPVFLVAGAAVVVAVVTALTVSAWPESEPATAAAPTDGPPAAGPAHQAAGPAAEQERSAAILSRAEPPVAAPPVVPPARPMPPPSRPAEPPPPTGVRDDF